MRGTYTFTIFNSLSICGLLPIDVEVDAVQIYCVANQPTVPLTSVYTHITINID